MQYDENKTQMGVEWWGEWAPWRVSCCILLDTC